MTIINNAILIKYETLKAILGHVLTKYSLNTLMTL